MLHGRLQTCSAARFCSCRPPTLLNQLGAAGSIGVFNNGGKNEKILKVAILPEWLSGEGNSAEMQFIAAELEASGFLLLLQRKNTSQKLTNRK